MDMNAIAVAIIMALGSFGGSLYGIRKSNSLVDFRLNALTNEVKMHNDFARRIPVLEEQIKVCNHRIEDLEEEVKK